MSHHRRVEYTSDGSGNKLPSPYRVFEQLLARKVNIFVPMIEQNRKLTISFGARRSSVYIPSDSTSIPNFRNPSRVGGSRGAKREILVGVSLLLARIAVKKRICESNRAHRNWLVINSLTFEQRKRFANSVRERNTPPATGTCPDESAPFFFERPLNKKNTDCSLMLI